MTTETHTFDGDYEFPLMVEFSYSFNRGTPGTLSDPEGFEMEDFTVLSPKGFKITDEEAEALFEKMMGRK